MIGTCVATNGFRCFRAELDVVPHAPLKRGQGFGDFHHRRFVARVDGHAGGAGEVFFVFDPDADHPVRAAVFRFAAFLFGFGERQRLRIFSSGELERAVFVEVPFVGQRLRLGVTRGGRVDGGFEFTAGVVEPVRRFGFEVRRRRVGLVGDAVDRAVAEAFFAEEVGVVEVAVGAFGDLHPRVDLALAQEPPGRRGVGLSVFAGEHHPDAAADGVGEEEGAFVFGRELSALVEGETADRRARVGRAFVFRHHRLSMAVGEERLARTSPVRSRTSSCRR